MTLTGREPHSTIANTMAAAYLAMNSGSVSRSYNQVELFKAIAANFSITAAVVRTEMK